MKLYVFDDRLADGWVPFSLTRPCGELRYGAWLLRERIERFAGATASGAVTRSWLGAFAERGGPPVVDSAGIADDDDRLFLGSRVVPGGTLEPPEGAATLWMDDEPVGCFIRAGQATPDRGWFESPTRLPSTTDLELSGEVVPTVWDLVSRNPRRLADDLQRPGPDAGGADPLAGFDGVHRIGDGPLRIEAGARIEPGVVFDLREGGIWLGEGVEVRAGARLEGPLHASTGSRLLGGAISRLSAGPYSYVRGEIEETIVLGYANKAHEGFLGHAMLGRWVNLGAGTTNSDLKNNYGTVRVGPADRERDTGLRKFGCLIGDHAKTGIGTRLNTGTILGAGANVFGSEMPPKWVEPFSWGSGPGRVEYRQDRFLALASTVHERRNVDFDDATGIWLSEAWEAGRTGRDVECWMAAVADEREER